MSLPFEDDFTSDTTLNSFWDTSTDAGIITVSGTKYGGSTGSYGQIGFNLSAMRMIHSPLTYNTYTIQIVSGPCGFATAPGFVQFSFYLTLQDTIDNNVVIAQTPTGYSGIDNYGEQMSITGLNSTPGTTMTITVASNDPTSNTTSIMVNFYTDSTLSTLISTSTGVYAGKNTWGAAIPTFDVGGTADDFLASGASVYMGTAHCIARDSIFDTCYGPKAVQDLCSGDMVFDSAGEISTVVKVWQTKKPLAKKCVRVGTVIISDDHKVRIGGQWCSGGSTDIPHCKQTIFYQIQTDSYGITAGEYVFSTWTRDYIRHNPEIAEDMI
jgi:hypothetical protein